MGLHTKDNLPTTKANRTLADIQQEIILSQSAQVQVDSMFDAGEDSAARGTKAAQRAGGKLGSYACVNAILRDLLELPPGQKRLDLLRQLAISHAPLLIAEAIGRQSPHDPQ